MTISKQASLVSTQVPEFIRSDYPLFVSFLEAYYEYVDTNTITKKLVSAKDIDETLDIFIESFRKDFATNIPAMQNLSTNDFLRNAKAFYASRGTEASFRFLFRAMYGKEIGVFYPETEMLRCSDGRWSQEISAVVSTISGDPFICAGQRVSINSATTSIVRQVTRVKFIRDTYYEIFFENVGYLNIAPAFTVTYGDYRGIVGYVADKVIVTKPGAGFKVGQIFTVNDTFGVGAKIRVTRVDSNGGILFAKPVSFGSGYTGSTYYGRLVAKFTGATINPISTQHDKTGGTSDSGVVFDYEYSAEYSSGYEGFVYSSFYSDSTEPPAGGTYDEADVAHIEVRFSGLAKYPGYYTTSNGFLSDTMKLQDNYYYQIYSYVLKLDEQMSTYRALVKNLLHPAGMAMFGEYELTTTGSIGATINLLDKVLKINLIDNATATDLVPLMTTLKVLVDTFTVVDTKYITVGKMLADSFTVVDSGSLTRIVPGNFDNYPTESYFDPSSYYTVGQSTVLATW